MRPHLFSVSRQAVGFSLLFSVLTGALPAFAASFPDVPTSSPHAMSIQALVEAGVIGGKQDGKFWPALAVNRAEMLKMLYKAAGKTPAAISTSCFHNEFNASEWFAAFVCDAYRNGYVRGYEDGTFKPAAPVSIAEAVKMAYAVFELEVNTEVSAATWTLPNALHTGWYAAYFSTALTQHVLPLPGQGLGDIFPNAALQRDQAASLVYAVMQVTPTAASSSSVSQTSSTAGKPAKIPETKKVTFPFSDEWQFSAKNIINYTFSLKAKTLADISVQLKDRTGSVTCRLFKIQPDGFSSEYYLGFEDANNCYLLSALTAGDYQLQLQPSVNNASFTVTAKVGSGDGNDGISQAETLNINKTRLDFLGSADLEDWYMFRVTTTLEEGQPLKVEVTSNDPVQCLIYPWSDVDLFGFTGPVCNENYLYPSGTYYVRVGHGVPRTTRETYSVRLTK